MNYYKSRNRQFLRLKNYDYTQKGVYFITICTCKRECIFGDIVNGTMKLNEHGKIVAEEWYRSGIIRDEIDPDSLVIMLAHIHGIVFIVPVSLCRDFRFKIPLNESESAASQNKNPGLKSRSSGSFVRGFKTSVSFRINSFIILKNE